MGDTSDPGRIRLGLTPGHISAFLAVIGFAVLVAGGLVTLGSMRTRADATERTADTAKAIADAGATRLAVHEAQIESVKATLTRIEGKIDAALAGRKP